MHNRSEGQDGAHQDADNDIDNDSISVEQQRSILQAIERRHNVAQIPSPGKKRKLKAPASPATFKGQKNIRSFFRPQQK